MEAKLTRREMEIAEMLVYGGDLKGIADSLCVSVETVRSHYRALHEKLHLQKATEIVTWWFTQHYHIRMEAKRFGRKVWAITFTMLILTTIFNNVDMNRMGRRASRGRRVQETEILIDN